MRLLLAFVMLLTVAAAPAAPAQPAQPVATATGNGGELLVSWNAAPGARFYTVGWINKGEFNDMQAAGRDWRDALHYATVPAPYTTHTVMGLKQGAEYYTIIGARISRFGGEQPVWSAWSAPVTTAGQHGTGSCPITGLPIPAGGYLRVGETQRWGNGWLRFDSAEPIPGLIDMVINGRLRTIRWDGEGGVKPRADRVFLGICVSYNSPDSSPEYHWRTVDKNLSTDLGMGFRKGSVWNGSGPPEETYATCDVWSIPKDATNAVYAIFDPPDADFLLRIDL